MPPPPPFVRGLYATPSAVVQAPDYARRLVEECGVTCFVLRTGFDSTASATDLEGAAAIVGRLGAQKVLLVGTWWGEGIGAGPFSMRPLRRLLTYGPEEAHESQWPMLTPGPETDDVIRRRVGALCDHYHPEGICLTHARFRHAADINGLFEVGTTSSFGVAMQSAGLTVRDLESAVDAVQARLGRMRPHEAAEAAHGCDLAVLLDRLAGSQVLSRWFRLRCEVVCASIEAIFAPVRARATAVRFGVNAMGPLSSRLCGQDYGQLSAGLDFVQPLLGYVRWHLLQPVAVWARYLRTCVAGLTDHEALRISCGCLGLPSADLEAGLVGPDGSDEGPESFIFDAVGRGLRILRAAAGPAGIGMLPVLRGTDWPRTTIEQLARTAESLGLAGVLFQGSDFLAGPPPGPGWA